MERLADVFSEYGVPYQIDLGGGMVPEYLRERAQPASAVGRADPRRFARGTVFQEAGLAIFGSEDLFESPETAAKPIRPERGSFSADQFDLKAGDYVVHVEHGVGQFLGIREIAQGDTKGDYMLLEYAGGNKLYVPLSRMDLVQRFRGEGEAKPRSTRWAARPGPAPKPASKPRCATWRRSFSSSTPQRKLAAGLRVFRRQQLAARV